MSLTFESMGARLVTVLGACVLGGSHDCRIYSTLRHRHLVTPRPQTRRLLKLRHPSRSQRRHSDWEYTLK